MANELRVRQNFISGTGLTCTNAATSITQAGFSALPTIDTTNYCVLICESEIMWVTAHTAASTTVTVVRAQESTAAVAHSNVAWQHGPTAQDLNTPSCALVNSAAQSHTNNANWQAVLFDTEEFDTDNMHSTVTNTGRITINTAGLYVFTANVQFAASATGLRAIGYRLNGTGTNPPSFGRAQLGTPNAANEDGLTLTTLRRMAIADWVEIDAFQSSGGTLGLSRAGAEYPRLTACRIGD
jgi:hypothetical protein